MSRKGSGASMFKDYLAKRAGTELPAGNPAPEPEEPVAPRAPLPPAPLVKAGAVGAMARSLDQIKASSGQAVVEIPADRIDPSFAPDRVHVEGPGYEDLVRSISEGGQQVPVLLRPHPERPGRYQIAYGHRRVRALAGLKRPVRAVVREMTDEEVVLAQGQENSARSDLTYIEKARFADTLLKRDFPTPLVMSALGMEKTQFSRLMSLRGIPRWVTDAIGPAPKIGRPRWTELAIRLAPLDAEAVLGGLVADEGFRALGSDERFARVLAATVKPAEPAPPDPSILKDGRGRKLASVERGPSRLALVLESRKGMAFGEWLAGRLPDLHRQFEEQGKGGADQ